MSRSIWKGPFSIIFTHDPLEKNPSQKESLRVSGDTSKKKVWSRASMILPPHIGKEFLVHNGLGWQKIKVIKEMVGHKFGEFSSTRKKTIHKLKKKKQKKTLS